MCQGEFCERKHCFLKFIYLKQHIFNKLYVSQIISYNNKVLCYGYSDNTMYLFTQGVTYIRNMNKIK